jgi:hypothetical protein
MKCHSVHILIRIVVGNCARKGVIERSKTEKEREIGRKRFH